MQASYTLITKTTMAYDLEEQEQLATLKAWWKQYGNLVTWFVIAVLAAYASWSGWKYYQREQASKAALLYEEIVKAVEGKDQTRLARATGDIRERYARTPYASMGALLAAKSAFDANDMKSAKAYLQWVVDQSSGEEYQAIARLRLAGLLLDEKAYDEGLKLLTAPFPDQFAGLVADRRGDLLFAQNKIEDARAAYQQALEKTEVKNPARQLIQLKLDALGGSSTQAG
jgi:predicted negative regulator of RcsB-dependent stress response